MIVFLPLRKRKKLRSTAHQRLELRQQQLYGSTVQQCSQFLIH